VNKAVTQMDQAVQANASQTEELSSTAQGLAVQAAELQSLVGRFQLGARRGPATPEPARPVARSVAAPAAPAGRPDRAAVAAHAGVAHGNGRLADDGFEEF
jgi:methyl-accepting chemotaxis protein